ncbi:bilirubin oxidase [Pseudolysobacter antarcticus]|uniref:Bilirubin oxidase n=1 Tax=Pseudolysobacter antarcticus TaxID=2511995 RepID=A0A411HHF3_9GAMM|nr:multicopper oxidase [Pseudolysobacter antarcticus]QBB69945.1 bilirubin oxidase [Pseudolysobacter antarcticus]
MIITRRRFLQTSSLVASALAFGSVGRAGLPRTAREVAVLDPKNLKPFVDPLPIPAIARNAGLRASPTNAALQIPYYRMEMRALETQVHRDLKPTHCWGYAGSMPGPTIETRSGEGLLVDWINNLPQQHFLPIDHSIHGAEAELPEVRTVAHVHGARVPPESDGYPELWFTPGKSALYHYPNGQDATALWYHDHALGINRLNVYAGLFGAFLIRDAVEDALNLPRDQYEIPLLLCDRLFDQNGQLHYPVSANAKSPWIPELFANATLVNGKLFPYHNVEPRKYRLRVVNCANARYFHLSLDNGQPFQQIGCDQGLLPAPVTLKLLSLAPGERADIIIDFSSNAGTQIVLKNDVLPLLQFRVSKAAVKDTSVLPAALRAVPKLLESASVKTRDLTLEEVDDLVSDPVSLSLNSKHWCMPVTEDPVIDTIETWNMINLTDDSHAMHLHLVRFQILDRRRFDTFLYQTKKIMRYTGAAIPPEANEAGWKDTVRADPGMVTRIIAKFEGYTGRYVWHCHILEHEDNEMMRPFNVIAAPIAGTT